MLFPLFFADSVWEGALRGGLKGAIAGAIIGPLVWLALKANQRWNKKNNDQIPPSSNNT
jgi:hypothetical protein